MRAFSREALNTDTDLDDWLEAERELQHPATSEVA